jgi:hypothetical protein
MHGQQDIKIYALLFEYVRCKAMTSKKVADLYDSYTVIFSAIGKHNVQETQP